MKVGLAIVAGVCGAITLIGHFSPRPAVEADPFAETRAFVFASLKDPESARFGPFERGKGTAVCGQVSARNSFGGYSGARAFVFTPPADLMIDDGAPDWRERGITAEIFEDRGCSIGADHSRALEVRQAWDESNRRVAAWAAKN